MATVPEDLYLDVSIFSRLWPRQAQSLAVGV